VLLPEQCSEGGVGSLGSDPVISRQREWHLRPRAAESVPESERTLSEEEQHYKPK